MAGNTIIEEFTVKKSSITNKEYYNLSPRISNITSIDGKTINITIKDTNNFSKIAYKNTKEKSYKIINKNNKPINKNEVTISIPISEMTEKRKLLCTYKSI